MVISPLWRQVIGPNENKNNSKIFQNSRNETMSNEASIVSEIKYPESVQLGRFLGFLILLKNYIKIN